jgi:leucyl aminopeptidase
MWATYRRTRPADRPEVAARLTITSTSTAEGSCVATLTLSAKDPAALAADALVLALAAGPSRPRLLGAQSLPAPARRVLTDAIPLLAATGAADEVHRVPAVPGIAARCVVLTGLGEVRGTPTPEALRRAAGAAIRELAGTTRVALALPAADLPELAAACEGALLGAYAFTRYRTAPSPSVRPPVSSVVVVSSHSGAGAQAVARRARAVAEAVNGTRDLVNTAPADLYPAAFADISADVVDGLPVRVTVLDEKKLARGGYGGLLGVGQGSVRPPRLVRLDYSPADVQAHLALVGKGITFDSGGLSIKPAQGMESMKSDMSGAAAVLHTLAAVARLDLPVRLTGWLALAENMPSGTAQRPSDILTIRGGRTVEVLNTDAEGRLVLADAIVAAGEENPDAIIDVATLTGAQTVALGNRVSAIMANDDALRSRIHRVSEQAGEQFWPMPLPPELRASLDSRVADIANMGDRYGGMLVAGLFLKEFVGTRGNSSGGDPIPWAHLDIAGPAFNVGNAFGYTPMGGTGVAVRTLIGLVEDFRSSPLQ